MKSFTSAKDLAAYQAKLSKKYGDRTVVSVCSGTGCRAYGGAEVYESLLDEVKKHKSTAGSVIIKRTGCQGLCEKGPVVTVHPRKIFYVSVKPGDAADIITKTVMDGKVVDRLLWKDGDHKADHEQEIPFYKFQKRTLLNNHSLLDPSSLDDYLALGGYSALAKVLSRMTGDEVIAEVRKAGVRGRGGAGFPAGVKWETTKKAAGKEKYVIVNGDEGDPGAFMDCSLMEGNPHSVLEGLIIGAFAIGANKGFFYIRQEYPHALKSVLHAIDQAREAGFLGKDILGSGFHFDVEVHRGAGAFVSGESSALITAIEGNAGEPKLKYIRMSSKGLYDKPTNLNNVETWANIPLVINNGADWYRKTGTENSKGTKIFSLVGKVKNTGLVEVPMGLSLRSLIYDIGGGIKDDRKFKAIQIGGPSGGCLPEKHLDSPVDFDALTGLGAMMGSGGLIVMDEDSCMVDVAAYFLKFLEDESCGKCIPCREGISQLREIVDRMTKGRGVLEDLDFIEDISSLLASASLCALGSTAANPVQTAIRYFRDEFIEHIVEKKCRSLVCRDLIRFEIDPVKCTGCQACVKSCPANAITGAKKKVHSINRNKCTRCGACLSACPAKTGAIGKYTPGTASVKNSAEAAV
jgi:NADH-quinone oxidoreductase subunit F